MKGSTKLLLSLVVVGIVWLCVLYPSPMWEFFIGTLKTVGIVLGWIYVFVNFMSIGILVTEGRGELRDEDEGISLLVWLAMPIAATFTFMLDKADKHL